MMYHDIIERERRTNLAQECVEGLLSQLVPIPNRFSFRGTSSKLTLTIYHYLTSCKVHLYQVCSNIFLAMLCSMGSAVYNYWRKSFLTELRPALWIRGNIVTSHAAGPGSIPGRVDFLVEVFPVGFPQLQIKCQEIWATYVPGYHKAITYHSSRDDDGRL